MIKKAQMLLLDQKRVSFIRRLFAYMIDSYIVTLLCYAPMLYVLSLEPKGINTSIFIDKFSNQEIVLFFIISMVVSIVYLVILPKKTGQTLGKKILRIRIVSTNQEELTYKQLFFRQIIGMVLIEGILFKSSVFLQELMIRLLNLNPQVFQIYFMITGISIVCGIVNMKQTMFHDMLSKTRVVKI